MRRIFFTIPKLVISSGTPHESHRAQFGLANVSYMRVSASSDSLDTRNIGRYPCVQTPHPNHPPRHSLDHPGSTYNLYTQEIKKQNALLKERCNVLERQNQKLKEQNTFFHEQVKFLQSEKYYQQKRHEINHKSQNEVLESILAKCADDIKRLKLENEHLKISFTEVAARLETLERKYMQEPDAEVIQFKIRELEEKSKKLDNEFEHKSLTVDNLFVVHSNQISGLHTKLILATQLLRDLFLRLDKAIRKQIELEKTIEISLEETNREIGGIDLFQTSNLITVPTNHASSSSGEECEAENVKKLFTEYEREISRVLTIIKERLDKKYT